MDPNQYRNKPYEPPVLRKVGSFMNGEAPQQSATKRESQHPAPGIRQELKQNVLKGELPPIRSFEVSKEIADLIIKRTRIYTEIANKMGIFKPKNANILRSRILAFFETISEDSNTMRDDQSQDPNSNHQQNKAFARVQRPSSNNSPHREMHNIKPVEGNIPSSEQVVEFHNHINRIMNDQLNEFITGGTLPLFQNRSVSIAWDQELKTQKIVRMEEIINRTSKQTPYPLDKAMALAQLWLGNQGVATDFGIETTMSNRYTIGLNSNNYVVRRLRFDWSDLNGHPLNNTSQSQTKTLPHIHLEAFLVIPGKIDVELVNIHIPIEYKQ